MASAVLLPVSLLNALSMFAQTSHLLWLLALRSFSCVSSFHSCLNCDRLTFGGSVFRGGARNQVFMLSTFVCQVCLLTTVSLPVELPRLATGCCSCAAQSTLWM